MDSDEVEGVRVGSGAVFLLRSSGRHFEKGLELIIRGLDSKAGA